MHVVNEAISGVSGSHCLSYICNNYCIILFLSPMSREKNIESLINHQSSFHVANHLKKVRLLVRETPRLVNQVRLLGRVAPRLFQVANQVQKVRLLQMGAPRLVLVANLSLEDPKSEFYKCYYFFVNNYFVCVQINRIPRGLQTKGFITVTFHVIVHKPIWDWDESTAMYIRFGHQDLGNWNYDCGPLQLER